MAPMSGYWGEVTSSVDWCENNYEKTIYIAEFYNTLSSFAMVVVGILGYKLNGKSDVRIAFMYNIICIIGIGSTLFHGTLKHSMQMLDEVPMLWMVIFAVYNFAKTRFKIKSVFWDIFIASAAIISTCAAIFTSGLTQFFLFHFWFGSFELAGIIFLYLAHTDISDVYRVDEKAKKMDQIKGNWCTRVFGTNVANLFPNGVKFFGLAAFLWMIDTFGCKYVDGQSQTSIFSFNPQLHAWWHVLASISLANFNALSLAYKYIEEGSRVKITRHYYFLYKVNLDLNK